MIYLNQCPECKSKKVRIEKKLRFRRTFWAVLIMSFVILLGYLDDARRLGRLQKSETTSPYIGLITSGEEHISSEMTLLLLIVVALCVVAIGLFSAKKVTYHCNECTLTWGS